MGTMRASEIALVGDLQADVRRESVKIEVAAIEETVKF